MTLTAKQTEADQHAVREFEAAEAAFASGAPPETYRVQVKRVLDFAKTLPKDRREHWFAELTRIGEVVVHEPEEEQIAKTAEAPRKP